MRPLRSTIVFSIVVVICIAQVAWWILFQLREAERLEMIALEVMQDDARGVLAAFEVEEPADLLREAHRRRTMFAAEGAALGTLGLVGVVFFYAAMLRERRTQENQRRFLTGATHELKTPVATLRVGLESLLSETLPREKRPEYLRGMLREVDRLEHELSNILTAAGGKAERTATRTHGDLADDVRTVLDRLADRFRSARITLEIGTLEPCAVERDATAIRLVVHNLLDNAIKYTDPGGTVRVALHRNDAHAVLVVSDDGHGIPADELPRVFERFERGRSTPHVGGTGLGLSLVRELVEAHGGKVRAESAGPDQGSRFTVELPLPRGAG